MTDAVFLSLLNNDFTLERVQRTPNGQGGWEIGYVSNGTVRGRLRPASGAEVIAAQQEGYTLSHVLYVAAGADIQRGDRVAGAGQEVYVAGVREPSTSAHHLEIDCSNSQAEVSTPEGGGS